MLSFHVPPCARTLLDLTRRKYKVQRVCHSCPTAQPQLLHQPCSASAPRPLSTLRDVGNTTLLVCSSGEERDCWVGVSVHLGIMLDKTLLQKGCSKLSSLSSVQVEVVVKSNRFCKLLISHRALWSQCPGSGPCGTANSQKHSMDLVLIC